jgi:hypothetical protein
MDDDYDKALNDIPMSSKDKLTVWVVSVLTFLFFILALLVNLYY